MNIFLGLILIIPSYSNALTTKGEGINAENINTQLNYYKEKKPSFGYAPLGTIIAFHKNFNNHLNGGSQDYSNASNVTDSLPIPEGWAECNGTNVSVEVNGPLDPDGNGLFTLPNLN